MPENSPNKFLEQLVVLVRHEVDFIVVGGVAAVFEGAPIVTLDLDIVYDPSPGIWPRSSNPRKSPTATRIVLFCRFCAERMNSKDLDEELGEEVRRLHGVGTVLIIIGVACLLSGD